MSERLLVFGGRNFMDRSWLFDVLDDFHAELSVDVIIEGEAAGADRLARSWADHRNIEVLPFPAPWEDLECPGAKIRRSKAGRLYNAAAGPIRNTRMLRVGQPTAAIGFPGGSGTRDMAIKCWEYGIRPQMMRRE